MNHQKSTTTEKEKKYGKEKEREIKIKRESPQPKPEYGDQPWQTPETEDQLPEVGNRQ